MKTAREAYRGGQEVWLRENNIKVGSRVKVVAKARGYELGWGTIYSPKMDEFVGQEMEVTDITPENGLRLGGLYWWPYFVLAPVHSYKERQAEWLKKEDLKVGDFVVVGPKPDSFGDWGYCWPPAMDELVGEKVQVTDINPHHGIRLGKGGRWHWFPFFVLAKTTAPHFVDVFHRTYSGSGLGGVWSTEEEKTVADVHKEILNGYERDDVMYCRNLPGDYAGPPVAFNPSTGKAVEPQRQSVAEPTYANRQAKWLESTGVAVGDKVMVHYDTAALIAEAKRLGWGWPGEFTSGMFGAVQDQTPYFTVVEIHPSDGILVDVRFGLVRFPYFALTARYPLTSDYRTGQYQWIGKNKIRVGSSVVVEEEMEGKKGWRGTWYPDMDTMVGGAFTVRKWCSSNGVLLESGKDTFWFPFHVLRVATYADLQAQWVKENNIKAGSRVKVVAKASDLERGWDNSWAHPMGEAVGKEWVVDSVGHDIRLKLSTITLGFPYFVLEPVEPLMERWAVVLEGRSTPTYSCPTREEAEKLVGGHSHIVHLREVRE